MQNAQALDLFKLVPSAEFDHVVLVCRTCRDECGLPSFVFSASALRLSVAVTKAYQHYFSHHFPRKA